MVKRRDVLIATGGLLGAAVPLVGRAAPCPPSNIRVDGGAPTSSTCGATTAQADWNARTAAAGVLWAQRFQSAADVSRWTLNTTYNTLRSGQGVIPGDGCLRQFVPAGSGGVAGASRWGRPMQPQPGDINQPGVAEGAGLSAQAAWNSGANAYIANPAYTGSHGSPARSGVVIGNEFYFQFRVRFSPGRIYGSAVLGKMVYLSCNYNDPSQELLLRAKNENPPAAIYPYTNFGYLWNSILEEPQTSGGGTVNGQKQPGGAFTGCNQPNPGACYNWQEGVWQTVLVRFRPGLHRISQTSPPASATNAPAMNTLLEISVAQPGETSYTLVHRKSNYVWEYDNDAQNGTDSSSRHVYGFNWMNLNPFTGGNNWTNNPIDFYHEFDQLVFSLQPIACPQV